MPWIWMGEAFDYPADPESGATSVRLTTTLKHHVNVYCEHSYSSPDGTRIAILRSDCADPRMPPFDLLVGDLKTLRITIVERNCPGILVSTASWSGYIYYLSPGMDMLRVNLNTLEKEVVWTGWPFDSDFILHTMSPDLRYLIGQMQQPTFKTALVRIDLVEKDWQVIYEDGEISNAHPLFNPIHGNDISVMRAGGFAVNHRQEVRETGNPYITTHFYIDKDGGNERALPIGGTYSPPPTGHSNWVGDTGRLAFTTTWDYQNNTLHPGFTEGNVFTAAPGESKPQVFPMPEHRCNHIATSKCGRYFVADSYWKGIPGPIPLVVGNFATGKHRMLLTDCKASGGASACSHPHAYFTADNKHVIYNADPYMVGHVHAARVPEGFLESLS